MIKRILFFCVVLTMGIGIQCVFQGKTVLLVTATNKLEIERPSETIAVSWKTLKTQLPNIKERDFSLVDQNSRNEVTWQTIDFEKDGHSLIRKMMFLK